MLIDDLYEADYKDDLTEIDEGLEAEAERLALEDEGEEHEIYIPEIEEQ